VKFHGGQVSAIQIGTAQVGHWSGGAVQIGAAQTDRVQVGLAQFGTA
jgi:hypothetical protein